MLNVNEVRNLYQESIMASKEENVARVLEMNRKRDEAKGRVVSASGGATIPAPIAATPDPATEEDHGRGIDHG